MSAPPTVVTPRLLADAPAGKLISFQKVQELSQADIDALRNQMGFKAGELPATTNGAVLYAVKYATPDVHGNMTIASGLVSVPDTNNAPRPLMCSQHGTIPGAHNGPSENPKSGDRAFAVAGYAGTGYVVAMADYLGYGASAEPHPERFFEPKLAHVTGANRQRIMHPYIDAATEASAGRDVIRATRELMRALGIPLSGQLFIEGYSQGGHAAMALTRHLESTAELRREFRVTASCPQAGPHDTIGSLAALIKNPAVFSAAESAFFFTSIDNHVGLADSIDQIFSADDAERIWKNLSEAPNTDWSEGLLSRSPLSILNAGYAAAMFRDGQLVPDHPLVRAIAANNTNNWATTTPIRLVHGRDDIEAPYALNGPATVDAMRKLGSTNIDLLTVPGGHAEASKPALIGAATWFEQFRQR